MTRHAITPRKLRFDFASVPAHWFGGNRVATHVANAVNMLFPAGERFFVRSVHHFLDHPAVQADPALVEQIRGFSGQEGKHAKAHDDFNDLMRAQGFQIDAHLARHEKMAYGWLEPRTPPKLRLAATAAAEHFTAIMAENAFRQQVLAHAHPVMRDLLMWHAAEEIEHKAVAFDVLRAVDDSYLLRIAGLAFATVMLGSWWLAGTVLLLRQEKLSLAEIRAEGKQMRAARGAGGDDGVARNVFLRGIREYLRRDFHPDDNDTYHLAADYFRSIDQAAPAPAA